MTPEEYEKLRLGTRKVADKLRGGKFTKRALRRLLTGER
jgi:hypothetical protein